MTFPHSVSMNRVIQPSVLLLDCKSKHIIFLNIAFFVRNSFYSFIIKMKSPLKLHFCFPSYYMNVYLLTLMCKYKGIFITYCICIYVKLNIIIFFSFNFSSENYPYRCFMPQETLPRKKSQNIRFLTPQNFKKMIDFEMYF